MLPALLIGNGDPSRWKGVVGSLSYPHNKIQRVNCTINKTNGAVGCVNCHMRIARHALWSNLSMYIALEDNARESFRYDVSVIQDAVNWLSHFERIPRFVMLSILPEPFGISKGLRFKESRYVRAKSWGFYANELTQAMLCNRAFAKFILNECEGRVEQCSAYDEWLNQKNMMTFVTYPSPFQRAAASDVSSHATPQFNTFLGKCARNIASQQIVYAVFEVTIEYNVYMFVLILCFCMMCIVTSVSRSSSRTKYNYEKSIVLEKGRVAEEGFQGDHIKVDPEPGTFVFNPNADNAFLMPGDAESAIKYDFLKKKSYFLKMNAIFFHMKEDRS